VASEAATGIKLWTNQGSEALMRRYNSKDFEVR